MAERRPLVVIDGQVQELPSGDTTPGSGGGATAFTGLSDTPGTLGTAGQIPAVNGAGDALEWIDAPTDGQDGAPGADGADGQGVPVGGTTGQVLAKVDGTDYNTEWVDQSGGGGASLPAVTAAENNHLLAVYNGEWTNRDPFQNAVSYTKWGPSTFTNITPVWGGGMILRNPSYVGPAIRVEDAANPGTQTDVNFNADGVVRGTRPYGADTRLITVYDQWGSDDMTATLAANITLLEEDDNAGITCWQIDFSTTVGDGWLVSTEDESTAAWATEYPLVLSTFKRIDEGTLKVIHGTTNSGGFMNLGLWQEWQDLHLRANGGNATDWPNTDWNINSDVARTWQTAVQDGSVRNGNMNLHFNNSYDGFVTINGGAGISYDANQKYYWGDWPGLGSPFNGSCMELHIFSSTAAAQSAELEILGLSGAEFALDTNATVGDPRFLDIQEKANRSRMSQGEETGTTYSTVDDDWIGNVVKKMNNASAITVTVDSPPADPQPCTFVQTGAGAVSFVAGSGVTIHSAGGNLTIADQYGSATLIPDTDVADTFYLIGNLTT